MNYFIGGNRFLPPDKRSRGLQYGKAYTAFATQVIELCIGSPDTNRTIIALAYIEIELQHHPVRNLPEKRRK